MLKSTVAKTLERALGGKPDPKLLAAADAYKRIKQALTALEKELAGPKALLEAAAGKAPEGRLVVGPHSFALSTQTREYLDEKAATAALGAEALAPFRKTSTFNVLRIVT